MVKNIKISKNKKNWASFFRGNQIFQLASWILDSFNFGSGGYFFPFRHSFKPVISLCKDKIVSIKSYLSTRWSDLDTFEFVSSLKIEERDFFSSRNDQIIDIFVNTNVNVVDLCIKRCMIVAALSFLRFWIHFLWMVSDNLNSIVTFFKVVNCDTTIGRTHCKNFWVYLYCWTGQFRTKLDGIGPIILMRNF